MTTEELQSIVVAIDELLAYQEECKLRLGGSITLPSNGGWLAPLYGTQRPTGYLDGSRTRRGVSAQREQVGDLIVRTSRLPSGKLTAAGFAGPNT